MDKGPAPTGRARRGQTFSDAALPSEPSAPLHAGGRAQAPVLSANGVSLQELQLVRVTKEATRLKHRVDELTAHLASALSRISQMQEQAISQQAEVSTQRLHPPMGPAGTRLSMVVNTPPSLPSPGNNMPPDLMSSLLVPSPVAIPFNVVPRASRSALIPQRATPVDGGVPGTTPLPRATPAFSSGYSSRRPTATSPPPLGRTTATSPPPTKTPSPVVVLPSTTSPAPRALSPTGSNPPLIRPAPAPAPTPATPNSSRTAAVVAPPPPASSTILDPRDATARPLPTAPAPVPVTPTTTTATTAQSAPTPTVPLPSFSTAADDVFDAMNNWQDFVDPAFIRTRPGPDGPAGARRVTMLGGGSLVRAKKEPEADAANSKKALSRSRSAQALGGSASREEKVDSWLELTAPRVNEDGTKSRPLSVLEQNEARRRNATQLVMAAVNANAGPPVEPSTPLPDTPGVGALGVSSGVINNAAATPSTPTAPLPTTTTTTAAATTDTPATTAIAPPPAAAGTSTATTTPPARQMTRGIRIEDEKKSKRTTGFFDISPLHSDEDEPAPAKASPDAKAAGASATNTVASKSASSSAATNGNNAPTPQAVLAAVTAAAAAAETSNDEHNDTEDDDGDDEEDSSDGAELENVAPHEMFKLSGAGGATAEAIKNGAAKKTESPGSAKMRKRRMTNPFHKEYNPEAAKKQASSSPIPTESLLVEIQNLTARCLRAEAAMLEAKVEAANWQQQATKAVAELRWRERELTERSTEAQYWRDKTGNLLREIVIQEEVPATKGGSRYGNRPGRSESATRQRRRGRSESRNRGSSRTALIPAGGPSPLAESPEGGVGVAGSPPADGSAAELTPSVAALRDGEGGGARAVDDSNLSAVSGDERPRRRRRLEDASDTGADSVDDGASRRNQTTVSLAEMLAYSSAMNAERGPVTTRARGSGTFNESMMSSPAGSLASVDGRPQRRARAYGTSFSTLPNSRTTSVSTVDAREAAATVAPPANVVVNPNNPIGDDQDASTPVSRRSGTSTAAFLPTTTLPRRETGESISSVVVAPGGRVQDVQAGEARRDSGRRRREQASVSRALESYGSGRSLNASGAGADDDEMEEAPLTEPYESLSGSGGSASDGRHPRTKTNSTSSKVGAGEPPAASASSAAASAPTAAASTPEATTKGSGAAASSGSAKKKGFGFGTLLRRKKAEQAAAAPTETPSPSSTVSSPASSMRSARAGEAEEMGTPTEGDANDFPDQADSSMTGRVKNAFAKRASMMQTMIKRATTNRSALPDPVRLEKYNSKLRTWIDRRQGVLNEMDREENAARVEINRELEGLRERATRDLVRSYQEYAFLRIAAVQTRKKMELDGVALITRKIALVDSILQHSTPLVLAAERNFFANPPAMCAADMEIVAHGERLKIIDRTMRQRSRLFAMDRSRIRPLSKSARRELLQGIVADAPEGSAEPYYVEYLSEQQGQFNRAFLDTQAGCGRAVNEFVRDVALCPVDQLPRKITGFMQDLVADMCEVYDVNTRYAELLHTYVTRAVFPRLIGTPGSMGLLERVDADTRARDAKFRSQAAWLRNADPAIFYVRPELLPTVEHGVPYGTAIELMESVGLCEVPVDCLHTLVQTARAIHQQACLYAGGKTVLGADDMFPLFIYVVTHAFLGQPWHDVLFMYSYAGEHERGSEAGYYLTTLEAVLTFITNLNPTTLSASPTESPQRTP